LRTINVSVQPEHISVEMQHRNQVRMLWGDFALKRESTVEHRQRRRISALVSVQQRKELERPSRQSGTLCRTISQCFLEGATRFGKTLEPDEGVGYMFKSLRDAGVSCSKLLLADG
jgi:hypothetical protein